MVSSPHPGTALSYSPILSLEDTAGKAGWSTEVAFHDSLTWTMVPAEHRTR